MNDSLWNLDSLELLTTEIQSDKYYREIEKMFGYIRRGEPDRLKQRIEEVGIKPYAVDSMDLFPNAPQFVPPFAVGMAFMLALEGGLPIEYASMVLFHYQNIVQRKNVPKEELVDAMVDAVLELTTEVNRYNLSQVKGAVAQLCYKYISTHILEKISIEEMAKHCGYSVTGLQHIYKKETGMTLTETIMKEKIKTAMVLLDNTDESCSSIAESLAFSNQSYFTSCFKKETGMTPLQYRKSAKV